MSTFVDALNGHFERHCGCWGLEGAIFGLSETNPESIVMRDSVPLAPKEPCGDASCQTFAFFGNLGQFGTSFVPDIDLDLDGIQDALSFGVILRTTPVGALVHPEPE